jgi:hypothetical protein
MSEERRQYVQSTRKSKGACWKNKREVYVLSHMHIPSAEGRFKEGGKAVKHLVIEDYNNPYGAVFT